jgi:hypothetical protein
VAFDAGAVIGRLELNIAGWQKSVEAVKKDQTSLSGLVMRHEQQFKSLGKTLTVVGGIVVTSLGAMVKKTADYGDEMDELHQRTGASVELLTGLDGVLRKNGASTEDLATGMRFLSGKMVDANSGNKEAIALFKGLGISITDANGELRSTTDVLFDVATRFKGMENGAVKTTAAVDLLGRGGMSLIPTLNLGADGLKKEADQASRLGKVLTAEAAKACSDFNDALVDLKGGVQGVGIQIGQVLMPTVKNLIEKITGIAIKIREWAAEHPGLAEGLSKTALGLGTLMMTLGPILIALPSLVKWIQALKAISATPIIITIMIAIPVIAKAVSDFNSELRNMRDSMKEAGSSGFVAFLEGINSGWRRVALGMKDSNVVLSEANVLARLYMTEGGQGMKDILLQEASAADNLGLALKSLGIKTKTELATELKAAEDALKGLRGSIESTPGQVKILEDKIAGLKDAMSGLKTETRTLKEQFSLLEKTDLEKTFTRMLAALTKYKDKLTEAGEKKLIDDLIKLRSELDGTTPHVDTLADTLQRFFDGIEKGMTDADVESIGLQFSEMARQSQLAFEAAASGISPPMQKINWDMKMLGDAAQDSGVQLKTQLATELIKLEANLRLFQKTQSLTAPQTMQMVAQIINIYKQMGLAVPKEWQKIYDAAAKTSGDIKYVATSAADTTKSIWQECSTVISDSMRNIASAIAGLFNFKGLFGIADKTGAEIAKAARLMKDYYDGLVKAADSAYDKIKTMIEANTDAQIDAANEAYRVQELNISRAQEDQDRAREREYDVQDAKYERQYENQKNAIKNSTMTEKQKEVALNALETKFEAAKLAREIKREDQKVARDRRREDARYKRQEAEEKKIEAIRAAGLQKLLDLQNKHQADLDAIRKAEDLARQKQADDEEERQNSLWFKVKGIFATAVENMATIFLTSMLTGPGSIGDTIAKLAKKLIGKGTDTVTGALDGVGGKVKGLGATIGEFISGIGAGIGGFISGLATGVAGAVVAIATAIASSMVALATGIASAATIIAAAAPAIIVASLIGLGIVAALSLLKRLFASKGAGAGDGMGRVVERQDVQTGLLTMIRDTLNDNIKTALWTMSTKLSTLKDKLTFFNTPVQQIRDNLKMITSKNYLRDVVMGLKDVVSAIGKLPHAASGAIFSTPSLVHVAEHVPEIIMPLREFRGGGQAPINLTIPFYLDGKKLDERMLRIANGRVEWLHLQYQRSNRLIPSRSVGGP